MDQPRAGLFGSRGISRRDLFRTAGAVGAGLALSSPLLSACASSSGGGGAGGPSLKIGFVSPRPRGAPRVGGPGAPPPAPGPPPPQGGGEGGGGDNPHA